MFIQGARYRAVMPGISVTAAGGSGDLLEVRSPADCILIPIRAWVSTEDEETSQQVGIEFKTNATAGTGGVSVTPELTNQHLQASQTTCLRNNTTDAAGTEVLIDRRGSNLLGAGYEWNESGSVIVPISTSLVLALASALAADSILTAGIEWMELGQ